MKNRLQEQISLGEGKLTLLGLKVWVDEMQSAYDDYNMAYSLAKTQKDSEKTKCIIN